VQLIEPGRPLQAREIAPPAPGPGEISVGIGAAGICRSDMHYRAGFPTAGPLPLTLGHEVAGTVDAIGEGVDDSILDCRVALHYLVTCGTCRRCTSGTEQFCSVGEMLGKDRPGGYAESIVLPAANAHVVPDEVPLAHAAVMMCSTATAYHALEKAKPTSEDTVVVLGVGGLGMAAIQLARIRGAATVIAVDVDEAKLATAETHGAIGVRGGAGLAQRIIDAAGDRVDVVLDLVGSVPLLRAGLDASGPLARIVAVGLTPEALPVAPYRDLIVGERTLVGCSDHLSSEISELFALAASGRLAFDDIVTHSVPLDDEAINGVLDGMEALDSPVRTVVTPG
jgi:propanol-preferring alcohol dehydrogenase